MSSSCGGVDADFCRTVAAVFDDDSGGAAPAGMDDRRMTAAVATDDHEDPMSREGEFRSAIQSGLWMNRVDVSRQAFRFTRRDVREATQWSDSQLHRHLKRLADLEYLVVHRGKAGRRFDYELLYQGEGFEGQPFLMGLIDPAQLTPPASTTKTITP